MADFVVLSTETIPMYCRILHFSPQCFVSNSCKTLIGVHEMHGRMHPN